MPDLIVSIIGVGIAVALFVIGIVVDHGVSDDEDKEEKNSEELKGDRKRQK